MRDIFDQNKLQSNSIFKTGYLIYHNCCLQVDDKTENATYFKVIDPVSEKEHLVTVIYDENQKTTTCRCDCTIQSLKPKNLPLCSHIVSAITYCLFNYGRPKKNKEN